MEDIISRVFSILIAVIILFILPIYIVFEKKDDISYALALKVTNSFVDNVVEKGYLTDEMYTDFITELGATANVYDVSMEYVAKQYNPIVQVKDKDNTIVKEYDYTLAEDKFNSNKEDLVPTGTDKDTSTVELTYKLSEYKYTTDQILNYLNPNSNTYLSSENYTENGIDSHPTFPRIYGLKNEGLLVMNEGDQFNVVIRNTNTTIATVLFNTLTFGANAGNDTKVYINYGGTVKNQEYMPKLMGDVDDNGVFDDRDRDLIEGFCNGNEKFTLIQKITADVNKDGEITASDYNP